MNMSSKLGHFFNAKRISVVQKIVKKIGGKNSPKKLLKNLSRLQDGKTLKKCQKIEGKILKN